MLIVLPILDALSTTWPLQLGVAAWRYGTIGITSNYLLTPLMGLLFAVVAARVLEQRGAMRFLGVLSWIGGLLTLTMLVVFLLDSAEIHHQVVAEAMPTFKLGVVKAAGKLAVFSVFLIVLGFVSWRAAPAAAVEPSEGLLVRGR